MKLKRYWLGWLVGINDALWLIMLFIVIGTASDNSYIRRYESTESGELEYNGYETPYEYDLFVPELVTVTQFSCGGIAGPYTEHYDSIEALDMAQSKAFGCPSEVNLFRAERTQTTPVRLVGIKESMTIIFKHTGNQPFEVIKVPIEVSVSDVWSNVEPKIPWTGYLIFNVLILLCNLEFKKKETT